jgi:signal peptidase I
MDLQALDKVRCSLAAEALRSRGVLKLRAAGVSMLPTLWPGDLLTVQCLREEEVEPGEIVLYMRSDRFFVHRIVSQNPGQDNGSLITRGDCMPADDPPIGRSELLGKITEVQRSGSIFPPARRLSLTGRLLAYLFCHWNLFRCAGLRLWTYRYRSDGQVEGTFVRAAQ